MVEAEVVLQLAGMAQIDDGYKQRSGKPEAILS